MQSKQAPGCQAACSWDVGHGCSWKQYYIQGAGWQAAAAALCLLKNSSDSPWWHVLPCRAQSSIKQLQDIVLILLCVEGVLVCLSAVAYVVWLLYRVSVQRAALFTVFLTIPNGFLKTLANKNIKLSAEEGDSDGGQAAGCLAACDYAVILRWRQGHAY